MASEKYMGMKCIKYMLLTVNLMFVITAALIISVGTTIYSIYYDLDHFIRDGFYSPTSLFISIGILMLVVSLFGCIGAAKESTAMINVFALLLSLVFVLDVAAAIAAYCLQDGLLDMVTERMSFGIQTYYDQYGPAEAIDFVQSRLTCCGMDGPFDWNKVDEMPMLNQTAIKLPESCCPYSIMTQENKLCDSEMSYVNGCLGRLAYIISQSAFLLGTGALTIAFIQFVGIIFALVLARSIRQTKTDSERRQWEIREKIINNSYTQMAPHSNKMLDNPNPVVYVPHIGHTVS